MATVASLKEELKALGLSTSGKKEVLQQRLNDASRWTKYDSVYFFDNNSLSLPSTPLTIAGYDLDWTLIQPSVANETFCRSEDDWSFRPGMLEQLRAKRASGMTVVIFTNQARKSCRHITLGRLQKVAEAIGDCYVFAASARDECRKPAIGMWSLMTNLLQVSVNKAESFYCGDACGIGDAFSDSDKLFAENVGIEFVVPIGMKE